MSFSLEVNVREAYTDLRKVQTLLFRTLGLMRRFGLPEDINAAISLMQRMIMVANQLRLTMATLQAASGPMGWALLGVSVATTAFATGDLMNEMTSG